MSSASRKLATSIVAIGIAAGAVVLATAKACTQSTQSARCPQGFQALGARCCLLGQILQDNRCLGTPATCPSTHTATNGTCVVKARRVLIGPGSVRIGPGDWEAQGVVNPVDVIIAAPFRIDAAEVTVARWNACVQSEACASLASDDPGRPARGITFDEAASFCRWDDGALPTEDQWVYAAAGAKARRYPWGDTGAVCRRSSWGLVDGPCARNGAGPDLAAIHEDGATPEGVFDLAGSVAEWVVSRSGTPQARGGSWRTSLATELRTWHAEVRDPLKRWDDVGVRCIYPADQKESVHP